MALSGNSRSSKYIHCCKSLLKEGVMVFFLRSNAYDHPVIGRKSTFHPVFEPPAKAAGMDVHCEKLGTFIML